MVEIYLHHFVKEMKLNEVQILLPWLDRHMFRFVWFLLYYDEQFRKPLKWDVNFQAHNSLILTGTFIVLITAKERFIYLKKEIYETIIGSNLLQNRKAWKKCIMRFRNDWEGSTSIVIVWTLVSIYLTFSLRNHLKCNPSYIVEIWS